MVWFQFFSFPRYPQHIEEKSMGLYTHHRREALSQLCIAKTPALYPPETPCYHWLSP